MLMFNRTSLWGSMDRITVWGCLYIKPRREESLQILPRHVAVFPPFSSAEACRIILSSDQEQPVLWPRDSAPGPPVGFDSFSLAGNQPPIWVWYSEKTTSSQAPLPWTGQVTLSQASKHPKQPWKSRGLGMLHVAEAALSLSRNMGLLYPRSPHAHLAEPIHPQPAYCSVILNQPFTKATKLLFGVTAQLVEPHNTMLRICIIVIILYLLLLVTN